MDEEQSSRAAPFHGEGIEATKKILNLDKDATRADAKGGVAARVRSCVVESRKRVFACRAV